MKEYQEKKQAQWSIYLSRVLAHSFGEKEEQENIIEQAREKFERDYPKFENNN